MPRLTILLFLLTACTDYEDAKREETRYCMMVAEGSWGNFKPEIKCGD